MKLWVVVYFIQHTDKDTPLFLVAQTKEIAESAAWHAHTFEEVSILKGPECENIHDVDMYTKVLEAKTGYIWNNGGKIV